MPAENDFIEGNENVDIIEQEEGGGGEGEIARGEGKKE